MKTVSIIVPLYKGGKYVHSIISMVSENAKTMQSRGFSEKVELIFVNDYPKETIVISDHCTDLITVILISNEKNCGIHSSRVKGINHSSGEYIYLLDQDDRIMDSFLSSQLELIHNNESTDLIIANGILEYPLSSKTIYSNRFMHNLTKDIYAYAYFDNRIISPGQCLIRKAAIPNEWKNSFLSKNGADDMLLWLLILSKSSKIKLNPQVLYTHVNTGSNVSNDLSSMYESVDEMLEILERCSFVTKRVIQIIDYRNSLLASKSFNSHLPYYSRFIVRLELLLRKILAQIRICKQNSHV